MLSVVMLNVVSPRSASFRNRNLAFYLQTYLNEEVDRTEPSRSVRVPWYRYQTDTDKTLQTWGAVKFVRNSMFFVRKMRQDDAWSKVCFLSNDFCKFLFLHFFFKKFAFFWKLHRDCFFNKNIRNCSNSFRFPVSSFRLPVSGFRFPLGFHHRSWSPKRAQ